MQFNRGSSNKACARVYDNNKVAANASGYAKAIEISTILSSSSDTQYLSEDCVCFIIHDVVVYNTQLINKTPCWEGWWNGPLSSQPEFTITAWSQSTHEVQHSIH